MALLDRICKTSFLWVLAGLILICLVPTDQSLWIDEATTASMAAEPTISAFLGRLMSETESNAQWPLGLFYYWAGAKILGLSELGLRILSAVWVAVGFLIIWRIGVRTQLPYLSALFICNAFGWYYGGEARPYSMQIALGSGLLYAFVVIISTSGKTQRGINALVVFGPLLCASGMLAVVPFGVVAGLLVIVLFRRGWKPAGRDWAKILIAAGALVSIGCYYAWTLAEGKGAGTTGKWGVGLKNLFYSAYELLGFTGFGPGRFELRELALNGGIPGVLQGFINPIGCGVVVLLFLYIWAGVSFGKRLRDRDRMEGLLGILAIFVIGASIGILLILSLIADFPFWGRHLAPIFPFVVFVVAAAANPDCSNRWDLHHAIPLALCTTLLTSSLLVRFHPNHARDDYRGAAALARKSIQEGKTVWWAADSRAAASYYGVNFCNSGQLKQPFCVVKASDGIKADFSNDPMPGMIVFSKPDLYDKSGALRQYIEQNGLVETNRLKAFRVFEPP